MKKICDGVGSSRFDRPFQDVFVTSSTSNRGCQNFSWDEADMGRVPRNKRERRLAQNNTKIGIVSGLEISESGVVGARGTAVRDCPSWKYRKSSGKQ